MDWLGLVPWFTAVEQIISGINELSLKKIQYTSFRFWIFWLFHSWSDYFAPYLESVHERLLPRHTSSAEQLPTMFRNGWVEKGHFHHRANKINDRPVHIFCNSIVLNTVFWHQWMRALGTQVRDISRRFNTGFGIWDLPQKSSTKATFGTLGLNWDFFGTIFIHFWNF